MKKGDIVYWRGVLGTLWVGKVTSVKPDVVKGEGYCNCRTPWGGLERVAFGRIIEDPLAEFEKLRGLEAQRAKHKIESLEKELDVTRRRVESLQLEVQQRNIDLARVYAKSFNDIMPKWEEPK